MKQILCCDLDVVFRTCICWITAKSNIQSPSRDTATPIISMYADKRLFCIHIETTHTSKQVHCISLTTNINDFLVGLFERFSIQCLLAKSHYDARAYLRPNRPESCSKRQDSRLYNRINKCCSNADCSAYSTCNSNDIGRYTFPF